MVLIIYFSVFQAIALFFIFMWWKGWSGKSTSWLEGRGWGWRHLFFLLGAVFFQGLVLATLVFSSAQGPAPVDSPLLRLLLMFMWLVMCPVIVFGMLFWWPRFMLPGWIRERLRAGDPVKTAHPIPEVQHLMTKPQNTRLLTSGHEQGEQVGHQPGAARRTGSSEAGSGRLPQLPVVFKVSTGGWWFGGIVGVISAVVLAAAVLGVPASVFEGTSGLMPLYRVLALVGAPLAAVAGLYLLRGAARPEHVRVAADGLSTRSWQLDWDEVERVGVTGDPASQKGRVQLMVSDSVFAREGRNNRWFSGRPLGLGGMVNNEPIIQLQPGLKTAPLHVAELIETARTARGTNYEGPGVPR